MSHRTLVHTQTRFNCYANAYIHTRMLISHQMNEYIDGPKTASAHKRRLSDDTPGKPYFPRARMGSLSPETPLLQFSPGASRRRVTHPVPRPSPNSQLRTGKKHRRSADMMPSPYKLSRTGSSPKTTRAHSALPRNCIDYGMNPFPPMKTRTSSVSSNES